MHDEYWLQNAMIINFFIVGGIHVVHKKWYPLIWTVCESLQVTDLEHGKDLQVPLPPSVSVRCSRTCELLQLGSLGC